MSDCCAIPPKPNLNDQSVCPTCGEKGKVVQEETIRALTDKQWKDYDKIVDGYFCTNPKDSTVYFIPEQNLIIDKKNVTVRIGIKETEEPIYVCYCFRHTKSEIESDFITQGQSTIEDDIRQKVKDKLCSCEISNPTGRCCLGDVRQVINSVKEEM